MFFFLFVGISNKNPVKNFPIRNSKSKPEILDALRAFHLHFIFPKAIQEKSNKSLFEILGYWFEICS